ncbi:CBO2463/CBO2479 domain-containing protein [Natranaerobius trueperi]|uniref:S1 motif domain-containing protein n=1 Tax=Natranaerobius trueperi TaxID=759412 RepID=A0A226C1T0_9FIRM|nr:CBO2463/CBO2479 domain-containing protein [Natranaerobius trueperi]OWZ84367.1 hypothetical protein CDO51_03645 [Natranaerobius trueperi]
MIVILDNYGLYYFKGTVTKVDSGSCEVELDGRMGRIYVPIRLLVSDKSIQIGDMVELKISPIIVKGGKEI